MLLEADLNAVIKYVNLWNNRFSLGLTVYESRPDWAAWSIGNLLIIVCDAAPGLVSYETNNFNLQPVDAETQRVGQHLFELIKANFRILPVTEYKRVPGESDRMVAKSLANLAPVLVGTLLSVDEEGFRIWVREREPDITESELTERWTNYCQRVEAYNIAQKDWEAKWARRVSLTAEQAVAEVAAAFLGAEQPAASSASPNVLTVQGDINITQTGPVNQASIMGNITTGDPIGRDKL